MIEKYDEDGDAMLNRNECKAMTRDPSAGDIDGDGKVSVDEYLDWLLP